MCLLSLENDAADFVAYGHTDFSEKDFGTASHAFTADDFLAILVIQNGIYQLLDLFGARMITAVLFHVIDQLVCHGIYNDNLFSAAMQGRFVIKGAAVDDILGCFRDIGGLIRPVQAGCLLLLPLLSFRRKGLRSQRPGRR